jgi:hypothetical protein
MVFIETKPNSDSSTTDSKIPLIFISDHPLYLHAKAVEFCLEWAHLLPFSNVSMLQTSCVSQVQQVLDKTLKENKAMSLQDVLAQQSSSSAADKGRFSGQEQQQPQASVLSSSASPKSVADIEDIARVEGTENNYAVRSSLSSLFLCFCLSHSLVDSNSYRNRIL